MERLPTPEEQAINRLKIGLYDSDDIKIALRLIGDQTNTIKSLENELIDDTEYYKKAYIDLSGIIQETYRELPVIR